MRLDGVVISGCGMSAVSRGSTLTALELTVAAAENALADAKLTRADIDGITTWPGNVLMTPGASGPSIAAVQDSLGLELRWYCAANELPGGPLGALVDAAIAVAVGLCSHVLVYRTMTEGTARRAPRTFRWYEELVPEGVADQLEWLLPYGAVSAAHWLAPYATRYLYEYGLGREDLHAVVRNARARAAANPDAIYRDEVGLEQYLSARDVVWPLCMYDCDVPVDGSTAFVLSAVSACNERSRALTVESVGTSLRGRPHYEQWADFTTMASHDAAAELWRESTVTAGDVGVAALYDGFSILAPMWAEALGLRPAGAGLSLFAEPDASSAALINPGGGQLAAGRLHGFGMLFELCRHLRGEAVGEAHRGSQVGVATLGGGPVAGALVLTRT